MGEELSKNETKTLSLFMETCDSVVITHGDDGYIYIGEYEEGAREEE